MPAVDAAHEIIGKRIERALRIFPADAVERDDRARARILIGSIGFHGVERSGVIAYGEGMPGRFWCPYAVLLAFGSRAIRKKKGARGREQKNAHPWEPRSHP